MLNTLQLALWYQDKHATQVSYTAGNHSINMAAECVLNLMTLFYVFSKDMSLLLLKIYER